MNEAATASDLDVFTCPLDGWQLIEASAGTGKTWTICALYLRLLLEKNWPVQQILVVTFTNAAAAELRERIRTRLVEQLAVLRREAVAPDTGNSGESDRLDETLIERLLAAAGNDAPSRAQLLERLETARQHFDEAAIFTIHGFCQRALADMPFAAGLPFQQELLSDDHPLRLQAVNDFWRRRVANAGLAPELIDHLLAKGDSPASWTKLLQRLLGKTRARTLWPDDIDDDEAIDLPALDAAFARARSEWGDGSEAAAVLHAALTRLNNRSYTAKALEVATTGWTAWLADGPPLSPPANDKLKLFSAAFITLNTKQKYCSPEHPFFAAAADLLAIQQRAYGILQKQRLRLLRDLFASASVAVREQKRRQRVFSFDDMLLNLDAALCAGQPAWLATTLRERYPLALIDEFQDTDPLQYVIFKAIYGGDSERPASPLFLVGDPKQAIYSFRNADLPTYLAARRQTARTYTLRQNQRSTPALIDACNALFGANAQAFIHSGLHYWQVSAGQAPRQPLRDRSINGEQATAALHVWHLPGSDGDHLGQQAASDAVLRATAGEVARLLRAAQAGRIQLGERPLQPGDIAILVERHTQGRRLREALQAVGVASSELSQRSVFASADAADLEAVLLAIADPGRLPLLNRALASELMACDAAAIAALNDEPPRLLPIVSRFIGYHETWQRRGFAIMLRQWMHGESIVAGLLSRDDGERRLTNLLHLGELLQQADAEQPAPDALLRWLASQRESSANGGDEVAQLRLEADRQRVQIVTIHKAKGLEYGIVFCPFLWEMSGGATRATEGQEYHADDGQPVIDFRPTLSKDEEESIKQRRQEERAAESIRLIYVALTRAVQRCYLVAGLYQSVAFGHPTLTRSSRSPLNWLIAGDGMSFAQWRVHKLPAKQIDDAWRDWAATAAGVRWQTLPAPTVSGALTPASPPCLQARPAPAQIDAGWRLGSFSSLRHGAGGESAVSDHDAQTTSLLVNHPPPASPAELAPDDILRFPRGPAAGDCLHALFEHCDFSDANQWPAAIAYALARHPQTLPGDADDLADHLPAMLTRLLHDVLTTALPDGLRLADIAPRQRLVELAFNLPTANLSPAALNAWLAEYGYAVPRLAFQPLSGYLKGYIDLVVEHGGRYYLIDWKSNHLGQQPAAYGQQPLTAAMNWHGYHLQYLLYSVALQRYLRRRIAAYEPARHFGGVLYLFVRGVRPQWLDIDPSGNASPCGVYFHRPTDATLASLDALLQGAAR